jgi:hypothetical protein
MLLLPNLGIFPILPHGLTLKRSCSSFLHFHHGLQIAAPDHKDSSILGLGSCPRAALDNRSSRECTGHSRLHITCRTICIYTQLWYRMLPNFSPPCWPHISIRPGFMANCSDTFGFTELKPLKNTQIPVFWNAPAASSPSDHCRHFSYASLYFSQYAFSSSSLSDSYTSKDSSFWP